MERVERIAAAHAVQRCDVDATVDSDELGDRPGRQRSELHVLDISCEAKSFDQPDGQRAALAEPGAEEHQKARTCRAPHQMRDQLQRRGVGPVQVVEYTHHRLTDRQPLDEAGDRAMHPEPFLGRNGIVDRAAERLQRREHRGQGALPVHRQPFHRVFVQRLEVVVERVDDHTERQVDLELGRGALEHQAIASVCHVGGLVQQAGLADPGLARHHHEPRLSLARGIERRRKAPDLDLAPEEQVHGATLLATREGSAKSQGGRRVRSGWRSGPYPDVVRG